MNIKKLISALLLLVVGTTATLFAQTAVTVGSQVTDESNIVSGKAYLLQHQGNGTNTPWLEDAGTFYNCPNSVGNCNLASVWYLIDNGDGTWKIANAYTGKYWPKPTGNANLVGTDAASAGSWALNFSSGVAAPTCNGYRLNRNTPYLVGWNSGSGSVTQVKIYEVTASTLSTAATYSAFADKDINVSATETASISEGQWYVMKNRGRNGYAFENSGSMRNQGAVPSGLATDNAKFLVRFLNAGNGKYYLQNGLGNYWGAVPDNTAVPATALGTEKYTLGKINSTDGHFYLTSETNGIVLDCQENGYPVVGWGTSIPTTTGGNNDWQFFPVEFVEAWVPTTSEVYTINNTNPSRGALIYNPENPTYVWSSGKSGNFDASNANSQWVIIPTSTANQFYLYNVGAGKFAIPTGIAQSASNSWVFSDDAVAVIFEKQNDGTKKIKMASNPVSGTNAAYMAVSNNYTGPIINYNDVGGNFTITKVDGDASAAANAAVAKLVKNKTALTGAVTADDGWYVISIRTTSNSTATASPGRYIYPGTTNQANYPLTFTGGVDVQPSISDATFFTRFVKNGSDYNWQMTDGRYLINRSNVFPTASSEPVAVVPGYDNGCYIKSNGRFADPYVSNGNFFIGETSSYRTTWNIYPIDLDAAGLVAWQMVCDVAPESATITCSRSDVKGLTAVYKGGYIFLPTGVTPENTDFELEGAYEVTVDATAHIVTFAYDPNLAMVEGGVIVEQGWQTAGRDSEVMLLKVTAKPFKDAMNTTMTVSLKDGSAANISALKLYEANSNSPEIYSTGSGAPTKTEVATASISGATATFSIGDLTAGTHYYWIGATVSSTATLGAVLDAAVTGIAYQVAGQTAQNLDLTSVGNPADRGAMVFNVRSYPFLPRDNGSRVYRIPAMIVADDGSIVVAADKRYNSHTDIGAGHVIDIVIRRSTDGGKTWSTPTVIAKGLGPADNDKCGYGDPSLVKGKDGKIYCLFVAGNLGYFYGQKHIAMSTSTDNGVTWSSNESTPPLDLFSTGALKNYNTVGAAGYGLYDYFVTSGRGLYIPEDDILMYLIPAQTMTSATEHTGDSQDYIFYSRDGGESWYFSDTPMVQGGDEAKIIQMNDGSLLGSIRQSGDRCFNSATYTKNDDGKTLNFNFGSQWTSSQVKTGAANNQDILYYQRETTEGKTDVIIHSMTTGSHANLKLYYSTDKGKNWTEFLNVQTKGTRYVTMEKSPSGSLYLLFEDQSLNSAGGYTDYNHYPINFLEITCEQLETLIPTLNDYNVEQEADVKIVSGLNGETTYGSWSGNTWTSNDDSGVAGVTLTMSNGTHDKYSNWNSHYNLAYKPETANTPSTLTLTAPEGYIIQNYTLLAAKASSDEHTYTLTAENGTSITPAFASSASGYTALNVSDVNAKSTAITVNTTNTSYFLAIADFVVNLKRAVEYKVVDSKGNEWASQVVVFNSNSVADEMPVSLKRAFCTYTYYSDAACNTPISKIDGLTAIYVKCEYNGPFEFSTTENPKWYFMYAHKQNDANDYLAYADGNSYGVSAASFKEKYGDTQYHWAFIGSPYEVKVLNRSNNGYLSVGALPTTNTAVETAVVSSDETSNPNNTFSLYGFKSSHVVTTNPFSLCLNAKAGVFVNGANGNLYYHNAVVPDANLELSNWKDAHVMALEVPACYTRSTTEGNFGTICLPYDVISYTGAKFYKVAGKMMDGDALSYITLEEVTEPKGGVGYLFQADGNELKAFYVETGVLAEIENPTSTGLVGSYESQYIPQGGYMLKNNKVYYVDKENYAKVGVNRAYIDLSNIGEADESQAKLVRLVNGDLATGVSRVQTEVADEAVFNLAGQRVSKTTKGVYIINGKKVAVK